MIAAPDIFSIPIGERILIYSPRQSLAALVNRCAAAEIRDACLGETGPSNSLTEVIAGLHSPEMPVPAARSGPLADPFFLGIIPTRGCNLNCRYCDFAGHQKTEAVMELSLAKHAVDAYLSLLQTNQKQAAEVHFFGGEPFYAPRVVNFVVEYTRWRAAGLGLDVHFEVTTNGLFTQADCDWIADRFDTVVLSLDGPQDIQERQRPANHDRPVFEIITRNARQISKGPAELILRACITQDTVERMEEIAAWMMGEFRPRVVCFESLTDSQRSQAANLHSPEPFAFAHHFHRAACLLESNGIETVLSTANMSACQTSACPLGKDALIVSPDGSVDACYLLREDWETQGLDLHLGRLTGRGGWDIHPEALQQAREFAARPKPRCRDCFCRYHCAGGCHVHHSTGGVPGDYDDLCVRTRLVTAAGLLRRIGQHDLVDAWLGDRRALVAAAFQPSDRLLSQEATYGG